MAQSINHQAFWKERYQAKHWPWDLNAPTPHLNELFCPTTQPGLFSEIKQSLPKPPASVFIPGAGRAHDAVLFAKQGYEVTCIDLVAEARQNAQALYPEWIPEPIHYDVEDLLSLHEQTQWQYQFDLAFEHTCFCALPVSARKPYVDALHWVLKPNGLLLGIFWEHSDADGPPYSTTLSERIAVFSGKFKLIARAICPQTAGGRSGEEMVMLWRKL